MDEGQKKRHIGRGMKPRGNKAVKPQKEAKEMSDHSTTEGQQAPIVEAVLEPKEGNEMGGNLEAENSENPVQNLEKIEATVAQDEGLEAALDESGGEVIDAEFAEVDEWPTHCTHGASIKDPCEKCQAADMGNKSATDPSRNLQPLIAAQSAYGSMKFTEEPGEMWITKDGIKEILKRYGIGEQPDGSCGFIVKVQEGYTDAVRQWAESDGVPVERWLSDRLYEYISTYGAPAQGR
jgi:hypothetical protein